MTPFEVAQLRENVRVLAGEAPKAKRLAAVRIEDLLPILQIPQLQAGAPAGAAPTAAEYTALLRDVQRMHARLTEVATLLQAHLL